MTILGISSYAPQNAACLLHNGELISWSEDQSSINSHSSPKSSVQLCLEQANMNPTGIDAIAFHQAPKDQIKQLLSSYFLTAPYGIKTFTQKFPSRLKEAIYTKKTLKESLPNYRGKIFFIPHELSLSASSFFTSPFEKAAILTLCHTLGTVTASLATGTSNQITITKTLKQPHALTSLQLLCSHFLDIHTGNSEQLLTYSLLGKPTHLQTLKTKIIDLKTDGSFRIHPDYLPTITSKKNLHKLEKLFGIPRKEPNNPINENHANIAASFQTLTEEILILSAKTLQKTTQLESLCLQGEITKNWLALHALAEAQIFQNIWYPPTPSLNTSALGAALYLWHQTLRKPRATTKNFGTLYQHLKNEDATIQKTLSENKLPFQKLSPQNEAQILVQLLTKNKTLAYSPTDKPPHSYSPLPPPFLLCSPTHYKTPTLANILTSPILAILQEDAPQWFYLRKNRYSTSLPTPIAALPTLKTSSTFPNIPPNHYLRLQIITPEHPLHNLLYKYYQETLIPFFVQTPFEIPDQNPPSPHFLPNLQPNPTLMTTYQTFLKQPLIDALLLNNILFTKHNCQ